MPRAFSPWAALIGRHKCFHWNCVSPHRLQGALNLTAPLISTLSTHLCVLQVFYPSKDGTKIPMFLVHTRSLQKDGSHPVFLYGYGGFENAIQPFYKCVFYTNTRVWIKHWQHCNSVCVCVQYSKPAVHQTPGWDSCRGQHPRRRRIRSDVAQRYTEPLVVQQKQCPSDLKFFNCAPEWRGSCR